MSRVCFFDSFDKNKLPRSRIELHLHLNGSFRIETVWDLAKKKQMDLGYDTLEELKDAVIVRHPGTLTGMLDRFKIFMPVFIGDAEAVERGAYELCEDQAKDGVLYFEARYCPQVMSNVRVPPLASTDDPDTPEDLTPKQVVQSINAGLKRGQEDFGIKARSILSLLRGFPQWNSEVLELCKEFSTEGVVGIDIAGSEVPPNEYAVEYESNDEVAVFQKAASFGIHRTVHAGEVGPAANVSKAIKLMQAERIGHGYRVLEDQALYEEVLRKNIHLETCPNSSLLTGAVPMTAFKHPIVKFCEDGANFSISKDDTTVIGNTLNDDYRMLSKMGFDHSHFCRANFNAARSCFLPEPEKKLLIEQLQEIYNCK